jgi:hypothetical protein
MTTILRDSLGGNTHTVMVATLGAAEQQMDESISTCRFAQRVAKVSNQVRYFAWYGRDGSHVRRGGTVSRAGVFADEGLNAVFLPAGHVSIVEPTTHQPILYGCCLPGPRFSQGKWL